MSSIAKPVSSFARAIDWIDDRLNPIVVKELRQSMQSKIVISVLLLFLLTQLAVVMGMAWYAAIETRPDSSEQFMVGRNAFLVLHLILFGTCMLYVPASTALRLSGERSETNVDLLFVTTLKPRTIVWGKFVSSMIVTTLIFSVCAPFLTFTYLLRGIDLPTVFLMLAMDFFAVTVATMVGIFLACIPAGRLFKAVLGLGLLVMLTFGFFMVMGLTITMLEYGFIGPFSSGMMEGLGSTVLLSLVAMQLFFVLATAMLSPPTANRAPPVRLSLLAAWMISGGFFAWLSFTLHDDTTLLYVWVPGSVSLFCFTMLVGVSERQHWGPRVGRLIPRWPLLRPPAFLLYSGASCGLTYAIIMIVLTLLVGHYWKNHYAPGLGSSVKDWEELLEILTLVSLYAFCYCLTAMQFALRMLGTRLRPVHTWIVAMMLVALCSWLPFLIGWMIHYRRGFYMEYQLPVYWLLASPFMAAADTVNRLPYWRFVYAWTAIIVVLSLPWAFRQLASFRPYVSQPPKEAEST